MERLGILQVRPGHGYWDKSALRRMHNRPNGKLRPILQTELSKDLVQVFFDGPFRQVQLVGDFLV